MQHNIEHRLQAWNSRRKDIEDLDREAEVRPPAPLHEC